MTSLSAGQHSMLRYWAMNMVWVRFNAIVFTYTPAEQWRLETIAKDVSAVAFGAWIFVTGLFYVAAGAVGLLIFIVPLLLIYPDTSQTPPLLFAGALGLMCVFALSVGMPLAMAIGGRAIDRLAGTPPTPDAPGDAALYYKVLRQMGTMAVVGVVVTGIWGFVVTVFGIDTGQLSSNVTAIYLVAVIAQSALAYGYLRRRA